MKILICVFSLLLEFVFRYRNKSGSLENLDSDKYYAEKRNESNGKYFTINNATSRIDDNNVVSTNSVFIVSNDLNSRVEFLSTLFSCFY